MCREGEKAATTTSATNTIAAVPHMAPGSDGVCPFGLVLLHFISSFWSALSRIFKPLRIWDGKLDILKKILTVGKS